MVIGSWLEGAVPSRVEAAVSETATAGSGFQGSGAGRVPTAAVEDAGAESGSGGTATGHMETGVIPSVTSPEVTMAVSRAAGADSETGEAPACRGHDAASHYAQVILAAITLLLRPQMRDPRMTGSDLG